MKVLRACIIAFSMYSAIPVPTVKWERRDMEYVFCFFPLIGAVIGGLLLLWARLSQLLGLNDALAATGCVLLPVLLTGGIHLDGFCDTTDALASRQSRERKLEILKDSNVGAFALIGCICYFLLAFTLWQQVLSDHLGLRQLAVIFILSRSLSALAAITRKNARGSGMLATFTDSISGSIVKMIVLLWLLCCGLLLLWLDPLAGVALLVAAGLSYGHYYVMSEQQFGGITGDLAGWFLSVCELSCLLTFVIIKKVAVMA